MPARNVVGEALFAGEVFDRGAGVHLLRATATMRSSRWRINPTRVINGSSPARGAAAAERVRMNAGAPVSRSRRETAASGAQTSRRRIGWSFVMHISSRGLSCRLGCVHWRARLTNPQMISMLSMWRQRCIHRLAIGVAISHNLRSPIVRIRPDEPLELTQRGHWWNTSWTMCAGGFNDVL